MAAQCYESVIRRCERNACERSSKRLGVLAAIQPPNLIVTLSLNAPKMHSTRFAAPRQIS